MVVIMTKTLKSIMVIANWLLLISTGNAIKLYLWTSFLLIRVQGIITKEYQKRSKKSVSAKVVAILAVVTLIKDYFKI